MKRKTTQSGPDMPGNIQPKLLDGATALVKAKEHRDTANLIRKGAQERLNGIESLIAREKELAEDDFKYANRHDLMAAMFQAHFEMLPANSAS